MKKDIEKMDGKLKKNVRLERKKGKIKEWSNEKAKKWWMTLEKIREKKERMNEWMKERKKELVKYQRNGKKNN